ncbi:hypothetical protein B296_00031463 [Ensete ventricosum]|uniref:Uncharacterized protein n=1 Tax=Ensete ventricosum TaxID=4639 RepID=A0A426Y6M2_ENSVE|nr:hypothetical protein B296_00031463 [Ensete ventricosum]
MRRARLEATAATRGDGYSLRLRLPYNGEEEWATVMRLRAGRKQRQGKKRRRRGSYKGCGSGWQGWLRGARGISNSGAGSTGRSGQQGKRGCEGYGW